MKELNVEYDFVAVVDFLPEAEREKYQISQKLLSYLAQNGIEQNCLSCNSTIGFKAALIWLAGKSREGSRFLIHFIGHGAPDGLVMPDQSVMKWSAIAKLLAKMDTKAISHSILNMTSCWGVNAIKLADHLPEDVCFFGVLGPAIEIGFREGQKINTKVYKKLFSGFTINQIISDVNKEFGRQILFGLTADGYKRYRAGNLKR